MSTGPKELASDDGIMLVADSITLASPLGLARLKGNMKKHKNQVNCLTGLLNSPFEHRLRG